jgi:mono/diheme cytochrome c family protein
MGKRPFLYIISISFLAVVAFASESAGGRTNSTARVPEETGKQMFESRCAACHGVNGKGHGPAAAALKRAPADLTVLARKNNGVFPAGKVLDVLQNGPEIPAHGSAVMPVWGPVLATVNPENSQATLVNFLKVSHYLESLQEK